VTRISTFAAAMALLLAAVIVNPAEQQPVRIPPNSSEPTKCYRLLANSGLEISVGIALDACGGSIDGPKTVACLVEAWSPRDQGGLALTVGQGVDLCRVGGKRQP
jgi:hypothetical protein